MFGNLDSGSDFDTVPSGTLSVLLLLSPVAGNAGNRTQRRYHGWLETYHHLKRVAFACHRKCDRNCDSFCDADFRPGQHHYSIHLTN